MTSGRYTFEREIGRGASGPVHLGRDTLLGRDVALKRVGYVPGGTSPEEVRAEREARIAASLSHPHLVGVFDLVHERDSFWLVMEYVEGTSLSQLVKQDGPQSPERAARLVGQLASALAFVHANQVVHRDIKPSNVLVAHPGTSRESAKLTDFGIARAEEDRALTRTGLVTGSPAYLSPEVVTGERATPASDVWAMGATLFHLLAGHPPYDTSQNVLSTMYRIVNEPPPRLETDPRLAEVLEHTMATDPAERWSAEQVRDHLVSPRARRVGLSSSAPAAAARTGAPAPAPVAPAVPAARAAGATSALDRPLWHWVALAGTVTVATVTALVLGLANGDDDARGEPAARESASLSASSSSTRPSTAPEPSAPASGSTTVPEPDPSEEPTGQPTGAAITDEDLEEFARSYLVTAPNDPDSSWNRLTPEFQQAAGGWGSYRGWWTSVRDAELLSVRGDAGAMRVDYRVRYTLRNGRTSTENVSLGLVEKDGALLITDES